MFPSIVYNAITWLATAACGIWNYGTSHVGGWDESGAGVPAVWKGRRDNEVDVVLRFYEYELAAVNAAILYAIETGAAIVWRFDQTDAATQYSVYIVDPRIGTRLVPERDTDYPGALSYKLRLRTSNGAAFATYFHAT